MSDDLRTEDDIARLFADANPIPNHGRVDRGWRRATGITSITNRDTGSDVMIGLDVPRKSATEQGHDRRKWLLTAAVVALVVSIAVALFDRADRESDTTATPITTPDTLPPTRLAVVEDFIAALSSYDVEAVSGTLTPGAVPYLASGADDSTSLDDQLAWLAAFGWTWDIDGCREQGDAGAYCTARERNRLSDLVGLEMPATMLFGFDGGLIDQVVLSREFGGYRPEAFTPFYDWMLDNRADDVEELWIVVGNDVRPIVTRDAAELMDARITEYIAAQDDAAAMDEADVELAEAFIEALNARDETTLSSLAADPPALFADIAGAPHPTTYLAWLDAFDWRWEERECATEGDVVVCRVQVRNKLTHASGVERRDVIRFSTVNGLIEDVHIVEDDSEYSTRAFEPFVEWVAATYPEDLRTMWNFDSGCCSANRNEATIPLFEAHLDEWSSSDPLPTPAHRAFLAAMAGGDVETMSGLLAPGVAVAELWATSVDELPGLSALLSGLEWSWNVQSCSISRDEPDPVRTGISCVATPTWRLDDRDIDVPSTIVDFEFTSAGIASVATGNWFERSAAGLAPLFDWIRAVHPDEAASVLAERDGTTVPMLSDAAVGQLLDLVDEFLADA